MHTLPGLLILLNDRNQWGSLLLVPDESKPFLLDAGLLNVQNDDLNGLLSSILTTGRYSRLLGSGESQSNQNVNFSFLSSAHLGYLNMTSTSDSTSVWRKFMLFTCFGRDADPAAESGGRDPDDAMVDSDNVAGGADEIATEMLYMGRLLEEGRLRDEKIIDNLYEFHCENVRLNVRYVVASPSTTEEMLEVTRRAAEELGRKRDLALCVVGKSVGLITRLSVLLLTIGIMRGQDVGEYRAKLECRGEFVNVIYLSRQLMARAQLLWRYTVLIQQAFLPGVDRKTYSITYIIVNYKSKMNILTSIIRWI